jgi:hypothetical protein
VWNAFHLVAAACEHSLVFAACCGSFGGVFAWVSFVNGVVESAAEGFTYALELVSEVFGVC